MSLSRFLCEGRWNQKNLGTGLRQLPIEMREAQVVANCLRDFGKRSLTDSRFISSANRCAFTVRLLFRKIDVEQVNLVVSTYDIPFLIYEEAPVKDLVIGAIDGD